MPMSCRAEEEGVVRKRQGSMRRRRRKATGADGKEEIEPLTRQATGTKAIVDKVETAKQGSVSAPSCVAHQREWDTYRGWGRLKRRGGDVVGAKSAGAMSSFLPRLNTENHARTPPEKNPALKQ